jgi:membrane-associated protein
MFNESALLAMGALKLGSLSFIISYLAPILGGENAVLVVAFLSAKGYFPLWIVIIFAFLGMISIDSFWFLMTRSKWAKKVKKWNRKSENYRKLEASIEKMSHKNDIFILLISKIMIGTRILILIYLGLRKLTFKKFFLYNLIPTFIWSVALCYIGWFAGKGFYSLQKISNNLFITLTYVGIVIILFYVILRLLRKWLIKDTE